MSMPKPLSPPSRRRAVPDHLRRAARIVLLALALGLVGMGASAAEATTAAPGNAAGPRPPLFPKPRAAAAPGTIAADSATAAATASDDDANQRDLLILDNKQTISGTIVDPASLTEGIGKAALPGTGADDSYLINTGSGIFRVRKDRVVTVVLGLQSRLKDMSSSDLATLVALARWCVARNHDAEALSALDRAFSMPGFDNETRGLYASLIDRTADRGPAQALPLYRAYRDGGGTDQHILDRLGELEKAMSDYQAQLKAANLPDGFAPTGDQALAAAAKPPPAQDAAVAALAAIAAGLEAKTWDAENPQYSNPVTIKAATIGDADGGPKVLDITAEGGDKGKGAARLANLNFAVSDDNSVLTLHVHNLGDQPVKLAIAVKTGNYDYYESVTQTIPPGADFKEVRYNLKASTFKSKATNWANNGTVDNLGHLKEVQLLIYNDKVQQEIQVRGVNFIKNSEL
jgi:hypothetical protein